MEEWKLRLKQARENKKLNKTTFAKLVGVSNATVTDWEKSVADGGIKELSAPSLVKIYEVLGVDLYWLLSGKMPPKNADVTEPGVNAPSQDDAKKLVVVPAPEQRVEAAMPDMLQWVSAREAGLLTDFRTLGVPEQDTLLDVARSLPGRGRKQSRTDQR